MSKAKESKDGWIRHRGGKCPVERNCIVGVRLRDGTIRPQVFATGGPSEGNWEHRKTCNDIMAYRIHQPAEQPVAATEIPRNCQGRNCQMPDAEGHSEECFLDAAIDQGWAGPLEWRDRIRELTAQQEEITEIYNLQSSEISGERESLIQKLESEGFRLIDQVNAKIEDAGHSHEEMSDFKKWQEGDLIECLVDSSGAYTIGHLYSFIEISEWNSVRCVDDYDKENGLNPGAFKWHSRPST